MSPFAMAGCCVSAAQKPEPSLAGQPQMEEARTPFPKDSRFLIAHFWHGLKFQVFGSRTTRWGTVRLIPADNARPAFKTDDPNGSQPFRV